MKKEILEKLLKFSSKIVLKKYKPLVIGITGSIGKTSTKEAVFSVVDSRFNARKSYANYNTEIGVPLTILGIKTGPLLQWIFNLLKIISLILFRRPYPEVLILELGADKPGDIQYFKDFINFDIGVITEIGNTHLEQFKTINRVFKEKSTLVKDFKKDQIAILNLDNPYLEKLIPRLKCKIFTYGTKKEATLSTSLDSINISLPIQKNIPAGISFKFNYRGTNMPIRLPHIIHPQQVFSALAAILIGINLKINLVEIGEALGKFKSPAHRMKLLKAQKEAWIIDDSYNSSLEACVNALNIFPKIKNITGRKIAVLGDMLELGIKTEKAHRAVGETVAKTAEILFAIGERAQMIASEAQKKGMKPENIYCFSRSTSKITSEDPAKKIQSILKTGDVILVKGSRLMKLEKIVEALTVK
jgi:UDP-N-acetylmuramoyl-tripeptide--D-alanyl-D-alanine ligase